MGDLIYLIYIDILENIFVTERNLEKKYSNRKSTVIE